MRIVSGRWRGRALRAPAGTATRPTSDRVREAVFDMLASRLGADLGGEAAAALDAFAGSGALGLEALSRGVGRAVFVEADRGALQALRKNVETLAAGPVSRVVTGDAFRLARANALPAGPFSLLLLDPPYRIDAAQVGRLVADLRDRGALTPDAVIVYEHGAATGAVWPEGFAEDASRVYGSTGVTIARRDEKGGDR
jgi:16S rRNA (guanine966-N2)-methyltransferase